MVQLFRRIFLILNSLILLSLGVAYAAQANNLGVLGTAHVSGYDLDSEILPVFPVPWDSGSYFYSSNLPAALTQGQEDWIGDTFFLNIAKPPSVANNGMNNFTMEFRFSNATAHIWTVGQAEATIVSGVYSSVAATLSATTVNPGQSVTVTFTFRTKIDITTEDEARIKVSYLVAGIRRYIIINVMLRPI
ncbi:MAG: hypothetical protein FWG40_01370 [Peptococcaceae bacterium]|nr:hypothetical protein [Peptococcaceae bacterium]